MDSPSALVLTLGVAALALGAAPAAAQSRSFNLDHLQLAVTSGEFLSTEGAVPLDPGSFRFGAVYGYSDAPLQLDLTRCVGATCATSSLAAVSSRSLVDAFASVALGRRFGLGVDVPILLNQSGADVSSGAALGDLRLIGRADALELGDVRIAAMLAVRLPTGDTSRFLGDGSLVVEPRAIAEWSRGPLRAGLNLGLRLREQRKYYDLAVGQELFLSAAIGVRPRPFVDGFVEFHADTAISSEFLKKSATPVEVMVGVTGRFRGVSATAAVAAGLGEGYGTPKARVLFALAFDRERPRLQSLPPPPPPIRAEPPPPPPPPPRAAPAQRPVEIDPEEPNVHVGPDLVELVDPIFFDTNRKRIRRRFQEELVELARAIVKRPWIRALWISGHADWTGNEEWNFTLSELRAEEVRRFLVAQGVPSDRVRTLGHGATKPWFSNEQREGRAKNRRVMFLVEKAESEAPEVQL